MVARYGATSSLIFPADHASAPSGMPSGTPLAWLTADSPATGAFDRPKVSAIARHAETMSALIHVVMRPTVAVHDDSGHRQGYQLCVDWMELAGLAG